mgnify:CR=1 FL=1
MLAEKSVGEMKNTTHYGFAQIVADPDGNVLNPPPKNLTGLYIVQAGRGPKFEDFSLYEIERQYYGMLLIRKVYRDNDVPEIFKKAVETALKLTRSETGPVIFLRCWDK